MRASSKHEGPQIQTDLYLALGRAVREREAGGAASDRQTKTSNLETTDQDGRLGGHGTPGIVLL